MAGIGDPPVHKVSAFRRALADTLSAHETAWFLYAVEVTAGGAGAFAGAQLVPANPSAWQQGSYPILGVLAGIIAAVAIIFLGNFVRAPYRQRNEAWEQLLSMEKSLLDCVSLDGLQIEVLARPPSGLVLQGVTWPSRADVQVAIKLHNHAPYPVDYEILSMSVFIGGKTVSNPSDPRFDSRGGRIFPDKDVLFFYERIPDVLLSPIPLAGHVEYELSYTAVRVPDRSYRSRRRANFEFAPGGPAHFTLVD